MTVDTSTTTSVVSIDMDTSTTTPITPAVTFGDPRLTEQISNWANDPTSWGLNNTIELLDTALRMNIAGHDYTFKFGHIPDDDTAPIFSVHCTLTKNSATLADPSRVAGLFTVTVTNNDTAGTTVQITGGHAINEALTAEIAEKFAVHMERPWQPIDMKGIGQ